MQLPFAGLILLAGCFSAPPVPALTTQGEVRGTLGGSVSVPCQYQKVYQGNPKYWCRGAEWSTCSKVIETAGLEAEVKRGSVSIQDNHTLNTFTVTMENLTLGDAGTYWCGINKSGRDRNSRVNVMVLPALSTAVMVTTGSLSTANMTEHPKSTSIGFPHNAFQARVRETNLQ
nr:CMRF35-like molecule 3 [Pelodiscus sinensis]|eukprot:XP_025033933.1 CMRF35-like molecule 3 [Pelodiscus sinensis]